MMGPSVVQKITGMDLKQAQAQASDWFKLASAAQEASDWLQVHDVCVLQAIMWVHKWAGRLGNRSPYRQP
jgi:hypothetical protein